MPHNKLFHLFPVNCLQTIAIGSHQQKLRTRAKAKSGNMPPGKKTIRYQALNF